MKFTFEPRGPFDLTFQNQYFSNWPKGKKDPKEAVIVFPVEGWRESAIITMRERGANAIDIEVYGAREPEVAMRQALAVRSLDEDATDWPSIGARDPFVADLQQRYRYLRPSTFHSPYESAAVCVLASESTTVLHRKLIVDLSEQFGDAIEHRGTVYHAFPRPQVILGLKTFPGLSAAKIERLHSVAGGALSGMLDRSRLRELDEMEALAEIQTLPGITPNLAEMILFRGAGKPDGFIHTQRTYDSIKTAYGLSDWTSKEEILAISDRWSPFRLWVTVLIGFHTSKGNKVPGGQDR